MSENISNQNTTNEFIKLKIISKHDGNTLRSKCESVLFQTENGLMQILANHIPTIASIVSDSIIEIVEDKANKIVVKVESNGFLTFNQNECLITLADFKIVSTGSSESHDSKKLHKKAS